MNGPVREKVAPLAFIHPRQSGKRAREHWTRAPLRLDPRPVSETPAGKSGEGATSTVTLPAEPRLQGREASLVIGDAVAKLPVFAEQVAHLVYGVDDGDELGRQSDLRVRLSSLDALEKTGAAWTPEAQQPVRLDHPIEDDAGLVVVRLGVRPRTGRAEAAVVHGVNTMPSFQGVSRMWGTDDTD
jgi:hypothetical protein